MRAIVLVLVAGLAGCLDRNPFPPDDPGTVVNPGDPGGFPNVGCHSDADCAGGTVCARVGGCLAPAELRAVHISWTVNGKPASTAACDTRQSFEIDFASTSSNAHAGYAPVPCAEGKFTIDKLPMYYDSVSLGERGPLWRSAMIDAVTGEATLDLTF